MRSVAETGKVSPLAHTAAAARWYWGSVASSCCSCCLCLPHCGCSFCHSILHARECSQKMVFYTATAQIQGVSQKVFSNMGFLQLYTTIFSKKNYFSYHLYCHLSLLCRRRLRLSNIFWRCCSLNSEALAVSRQPKNSGATTVHKQCIYTKIKEDECRIQRKCCGWNSHNGDRKGSLN